MQLIPQIVKYAVKLKNVILPLDTIMFYKLLADSGFSTVRAGETTTDGLLTVAGDIARKGNVIVRLNEQTMVIGVDGTKKQEVLDVFRELTAIMLKSGVELNKHARFYELIAHYLIESEKNPAAAMQNFFGSVNLEQFDKIMENKCSLFTLKIVPKDVVIDTEDYYEVAIEPRIPRPYKAYSASIVYRSADSKKAETFTSLLDAKIQSVIKAIEQHQVQPEIK